MTSHIKEMSYFVCLHHWGGGHIDLPLTGCIGFEFVSRATTKEKYLILEPHN